MKAKKKLTKAKIQLQDEKPFFAYLLSHLNYNKNNDIPSIGVNSREKGNVAYNEDYIEDLEMEELKTVLAHEICHIILKHREEDLDNPRLSNIAQDIIVNDILWEDNFTFPADGLVPDYHEIEIADTRIEDINNKTSRKIYNILEEELNNETPQDAFPDQHNFGGEDQDENESQPQEQEKTPDDVKEEKKGKGNGKSDEQGKNWERITAQAIEYSKQRGELPEKLKRIAEDIIESKMNWRSLLYRYITQEIPNDYTWKLPHKKSHTLNTYFPRTKKEDIDITVAIDTSGSISEKELSEFLGEIRSIQNSFEQITITVLVADAEIQDTFELGSRSQYDLSNIDLYGGGGTDHRPIFRWIKDNKPSNKVLISLTDGYTAFPEKRPNYDVIWVLTGNSAPEEDIPFGRIIQKEENV